MCSSNSRVQNVEISGGYGHESDDVRYLDNVVHLPGSNAETFQTFSHFSSHKKLGRLEHWCTHGGFP